MPVVSTGLSGPLFVGHAGDGTNRLFIVERGGMIKVLQPGASTTTDFLDIRSRVTTGGTELVAVELGAFADGWVQVTGDVAEGDDVVVPA